MSFYVNSSFEVEHEIYDGQSVLSVSLSSESIKELCLALSFLWNELVSDIVIVGKSAKGESYHLNIFKTNLKRSKISANVKSKRYTYTLESTCGDIEYLSHFLMRTIINGRAEVDHLDLEVDRNDSHGLQGYLTFKFPNFTPSLSEAEAKRRLGML